MEPHLSNKSLLSFSLQDCDAVLAILNFFFPKTAESMLLCYNGTSQRIIVRSSLITCLPVDVVSAHLMINIRVQPRIPSCSERPWYTTEEAQ